LAAKLSQLKRELVEYQNKVQKLESDLDESNISHSATVKRLNDVE